MGSSLENVIENVSVRETWARLEADATAVLIDVRTQAEWAYVGVVDLASLSRRPVLIEWQSFPSNRIDPSFVDALTAELAALGASKATELFFICRSGGRSHMAAQTMARAGHTRCRNVAEGFEGPLDALHHRGQIAGWKASSLPWIQG